MTCKRMNTHLLPRLLLALLATFLVAGPALAQDEATAPATTDTAAGELSADERAEQQKEQTRQTILKQTGLPQQNDTGMQRDVFSGDPLIVNWMPQEASAEAGDTDFLFDFITYITYFFTFLILAAMVWFLIRYRARSDEEPDPTNVSTHSTSLEITWTVIPTCIVLLMFTLGFKGYLNQTIAPPNAYEVKVNGQMWNWSFTYPNGANTPDLHLPKDRPVKFTLTSADVLHSFFIPAFRMKKDVVPGRNNNTWATPDTEGVFEIFCAEYCGTRHSKMGAKAFVYPQDQYDAVLAEISNIYFEPFTDPPVARTPVEVGEAIWSGRGCQGCHSVDGSKGTGPSWRNIWGQEHQFTDGTSAVVDEAYIQESIWYPQAKIVQGYGNAMPSYLGQLDQRDVDSVIAYIKSVSDNAKEDETGQTVEPEESTSLDEDAPSS